MDGARIQLHKVGDSVRIYTRSSNEVTAAVPEIVETVQSLPAREMILDGEAIAFTADGRPRPFQVTMRRFGRKLDVEKLRSELPMQAFFFDCLHFEGETLTGSAGARAFRCAGARSAGGVDHSSPDHQLSGSGAEFLRRRTGGRPRRA